MNTSKEQKTGVVKHFDSSKGYGFIKQDQGDDIFFHVTKVNGEVDQDAEVSYEIGQGKKGEMAINVTRL